MHFLANPILRAGVRHRHAQLRSWQWLETHRQPCIGYHSSLRHSDALPFMAQHGDFSCTDFSHVRFAGAEERLHHYPIEGMGEVRCHCLIWHDRNTVCHCTGSEDAQRRSAPRKACLACGRVVDADGKDVAPGETGEIWVKGPSVMSATGVRRRPLVRPLRTAGFVQATRRGSTTKATTTSWIAGKTYYYPAARRLSGRNRECHPPDRGGRGTAVIGA